MEIPHPNIHVTGKLITPPLQRLLDEKISLFHRHKLRGADEVDIVGFLVDYTFIETDKSCGGYCNAEKKIIALNKSVPEDELRTKNFDLWMPQRLWNRQTIMHEIGHAIQAEVGLLETGMTVSAKLKTEWQAESISYQLYNKCFGKLDYRYFNSYFSETDVEFLKNWWSGWIENDVP